MHRYTAHITSSDGITHRYSLIAMDLEDARREARLLAASMFRKFTFSVREA